MSRAGWRLEAALAALLALAGLAVGVMVGASFVFRWLNRPPVFEDAAAVPAVSTIVASGLDAASIASLRQRARAVVVEDHLPGLSVAVAVDGEVVWAEGFGWIDAESRRPITPDTRFRLGALSKPMTAFGAALLHDRGRLDLDAPIQRYLPAYPEQRWPVTTRQLLSDVAGVHRIRGDNNDAMPVTHCDDLDEAVALLVDDPVLFEPGTQHRYSNWGWVLASAVVEEAAGMRFGRFMRREVFEPLGMARTVVEERDDLDEVAHATDRPDYSCIAGGGAFLSTPTDLVRFGSAWLAPGALRAETIAIFHTPPRLPSGQSTTYAMGWTVGTADVAGRTTRLVSHRGSPAGGTVTLLTFPDLHVAVAIAGNITDAAGVHPLGLQVADAFARARVP